MVRIRQSLAIPIAAWQLALACGGTVDAGNSLTGGASAVGGAPGSTGGAAGSAGSRSTDASTDPSVASGSGGSGGIVIEQDAAGTSSCNCPVADFRIEVVGANVAELRFNAPNGGAACMDGPLRGHATDTCGLITLDVAACLGEGGALPCLTTSNNQVTYIDASGRVFTSASAEVTVSQTGVLPDTPELLVGNYSARVVAAGAELAIGGSFVLCGSLYVSLLPC